MAKGLLGVALLAGWLGVSASAYAQSGPAPSAATGPGAPPAMAGGPVPGFYPGPQPPAPGAEFCPPPLAQSQPVAESLPDNAFSNVHPEQVSPSPCFYFGTDYLLWWVRKRQVPPLVTIGDLRDPFPGAGGQPGTLAVVGPGTVDLAPQSGVRVNGVVWFDQDHTFGIDASAFWLPDVTERRIIAGFGQTRSDAILSRPFFNVNTGTQDADPLVVPGIQAGGLTLNLPRQFWGADADLRCGGCVDCGPISKLTLLAGARFLKLDEKLLIGETVTELPAQGVAGSSVALQDNFSTSNRFYGGQLGLEAESHVGNLVLTVTGKVAAGENWEEVAVNGASLLTLPDGRIVFDPRRGLLVQPTNFGRITRPHFAVAPQLSVNLAWVFNEHLRVSMGYDFLYWSHVVRPGDQIDRQVNVGAIGQTGQFGTSPHPLIPFNTTGFWAQGLSAGLQVSF